MTVEDIKSYVERQLASARKLEAQNVPVGAPSYWNGHINAYECLLKVIERGM